MKTKGLPALVVVTILLAAVLAPAMGLSLLNDSNSSFPVPVTPSPSPPVEESDNNATDIDTEANETEIIDDEISLPPLSENLKFTGKDSFGANETPEFVIEIEQAFIDAIADVSDGEPVQVQFHVEGCEGNKNRLDLFVEEEETSPSSNITIYRVTIPNNKTGTEELTPGIYTLVVVVGEQSVEHAFEWGLKTEPETEPGDEIKEPLDLSLSENLEIIGKDSFGANETPEFFIQIQQDFIEAISDADSGEPVEIQIYVEGCNGSRIELFVEEEETSPSSNISIYRVTISNNKTGTEELTPGIYTLVVEVGEQSVEHPFGWGLEPEPTYVEPQLQNLTVNITTKPVLTAKKKHFVLNENPTFKFKFNYKTKAEAEAETNATSLKPLAISEPKKAAKTWVTAVETIKTSVYYKDELLDIELEIEKLGEGDFSIKIPSQRAFRAGLYKLKVELVKDNKTYVEEQDFTWGVLAINTHKSIYLPDETAFIGIAVLDNEGHTVCDADVTLTITDPGNKETVLSTGNGLIKVSPQCSVYGVTNLPDYYTNYKVGGVGTYVMTLIAVTADGTKSIADEFTVQNSVEFDVARSGPTRIFPPVPYVMNFTIKANKNYNGLIKEYVPVSFEITPQEGLTVTTVGDTKILTWNRNLVKGEVYNIYYEFDAPDVSPYLFVLGRLQIGSFEEKRDWMIASDAPDTEGLWSVSNSVSNGLALTNSANANGATTGTWADASGKWAKSGYWWEFVMEDSAQTGTINSVAIYLKHYQSGWADDNFKIQIYDGSTWLDVQSYPSGGNPPTSDTTDNWDVKAVGIDTWTEINAAKVRIIGNGVSKGEDTVDWFVDTVELRIDYTPPDTTAPLWQNHGQNNSAPAEGEAVLLYAQGKDETALDFAILETNETGGWLNITDGSYGSPVDMSDAANTWEWSNFTWQNSSITAGTTVGWRIWYNDTSDNWNATDIQTFVVQSAEVITHVTPFMIYGRVFYEDGSECNGSTVKITNLNNSKQWTAKTNASYNYYQRILANGTDLNASEVLQFNVSDGMRYNTTTHTVTEDEINDGGLFNFNFTLPTPPSPSTSYMIYGWVFYENGTACDNPTVNITNMNTSKQWQAETNASYNFYQITLAGGSDLNATEILQFNVKAPDASQFNTSNHTVTQDEIDNGGLFSYNITLEAPETPFMIYGWVFYENSSECNNPTVNITNTNTSIHWLAKTNASYNYYQLILDTTNISMGNVLSFNATDGTEFNVTNHTVTQGDINNGGLFNFNLTLPSLITEAPTVDSITITPDDEPAEEGVQINPTPGGNTAVNISAVVSDPNGWNDVDTVNATITGPGTVADSPVSLTFVSNSSLMTATYNGTFNMSFYYANGTYTVDVTATDNGGLTGSNSTTFEYQTAIGLELDSTLINFSSSGPIDPGETSEVLGDENMETLNNATVWNIGNVVIDVEVNGTNMCTDFPTCSGNVITKDNIDARINETSYQDMSVTRCFDVNMTVAELSLENADFKLFVPYGTPQGNYSGTITLTAKTC